MRRIVVTFLTLLALFGVVGFTAGLFTSEEQREDSCMICRAIRYSGRHYGIPYQRVENGPLTEWYRLNIDPQHGRDAQHAHVWRQSACTDYVRPGFDGISHDCSWLPPLFALSPDIELAVLRQIPDRRTQVRVIRSLNSVSRKANAKRVNLLIQFYDVDSKDMSWSRWWRLHSDEFVPDDE